jgi:hypothetical protein
VASGASLTVASGATLTSAVNPVFEGATANDYETTLSITDPTADRTITLPDMSGVALVGAAANKVIFGSNTITATQVLSHGLTTPLYAFCTLGANASATGNTCSTTIVTSTVTVKTWKPNGTTPGDAGLKVYWQVVGTP